MRTSLIEQGQAGGVRRAVMVNADDSQGVLWAWPHERERVVSDDTTLTRSMRFRASEPRRCGARVRNRKVFDLACDAADLVDATAAASESWRIVRVVLLLIILFFILAWIHPTGQNIWLGR